MSGSNEIGSKYTWIKHKLMANAFQIKIPLTSEISTQYLICNENEFNCLKFIITEHLVIDQLLNKSTDQFQLN